MFGDDCLFHPVMKAGDLIVSSNWIIHGSYHTPEMTQTRTNIEIRFMGEKLDVEPDFMTRSLMKFRRIVGRVSAREPQMAD
jgi:O-acetylhomoserine/O-acetylserine sulfhydrylase-like pyridoxal-dependent enzyme